MIKAAAYNCSGLMNPEQFDIVYNLISEGRQAHVNEALNMKTRCERLGASHLLEKLLWENHYLRPYEYEYSDNGKPMLRNPKGLYFSLTHSDLIACAVISDKPVGIDIEIIGRCDEKVANRFFTKNDNEYIANAPSIADKQHRYTEVWTFKEALAKYMDRPLAQVLPWVDYHDCIEGHKRDIKWYKNGFEFRNYYITLIHNEGIMPISMGFYEPHEGKYY